MKTVHADLANCGTLVFAVVIVRTDATVLAYTQHDRDQTVMVGASPVVLLANPGFNLQSLVSSAGLGVDNTEITLLESDDITRTDVLATKWDGASVYFFRYNFKLPLSPIIPVKRGSFGNFTPQLGQFVVEFRDLRQAMQPNSTWVFQEGCRWRFGDARCGKDLAPLTFAFEVTAVASAYAFTIDVVEPDDTFGEGEVIFDAAPDGGLNAGLHFKVKGSVGGVITLSEAAILAVVAGDTGSIVAGCRKRFEEDCKTRHDNALNYGGEKDKPTRDSLTTPPPAVAS